MPTLLRGWSWGRLALLSLLSLLLPVVASGREGPDAERPRLVVTEGEQVVISISAVDGEIEVARLAPERLVLPIFAPFVTVSPDGKYGTYVTAEGATPAGVSLDGAVLWLVEMESGHAQAVWDSSDRLWPAAPGWSPDSARLAFWQAPADPAAARRGELEQWVLDVRSLRVTPARRDPSLTADLFYEEAGALPLAPAAALPCTVRRWSQHDPRWGGQTMRSCGLTISKAGCALTSTAMVFRYYGHGADPGALNGCLGNQACPIYWSVAASSCSGERVSYAGSAAFSWRRLEQELKRGAPPIVYLCKYDDCSRFTHFVVAVGAAGSGPGGYTINDPADGQRKSLSEYTSSGWVPLSLRLYHGTPDCDPSVAKARVYLPLVETGPR